MGVRLLAVVVVASRRRLYVEPTQEIEIVAGSLKPEWRPGGTICGSTQYLGVRAIWNGQIRSAMFTERQLVALIDPSQNSGMRGARERVLADSALHVGNDGSMRGGCSRWGHRVPRRTRTWSQRYLGL